MNNNFWFLLYSWLYARYSFGKQGRPRSESSYNCFLIRICTFFRNGANPNTDQGLLYLTWTGRLENHGTLSSFSILHWCIRRWKKVPGFSMENVRILQGFPAWHGKSSIVRWKIWRWKKFQGFHVNMMENVRILQGFPP